MDRIQTPRAWLMTDVRLDDRLIEAIQAMPDGSGVVLRDPGHARADEVARLCFEQGIILAVARDCAAAVRLKAAFVHNPAGDRCGMPFSLSVHDEREAIEARRRGAALVFVSPVYPTRSHPGAAALGPDEARRLAKLCGCPAIALGGMNEARFAPLAARGFDGWAGIDAWLRI